VSYAVSDPPFDTVVVCTAGHPPPLVAEGDQTAYEAPVPPGLLLGVNPEQRRHAHELALGMSTALVFYTDGLVERLGGAAAGVQGWRERLDRVCRSFRSDQDAETICSRVIATGLGDDSVDDDVAVLAMRRTGSPDPARRELDT
jgi:serine phosphatase RsbU (regulator of sigma subunit)